MNLIKKNIILFSVLFVSLIISGVFIFLVINQTSQMDEANKKVKELQVKINDLNKESPIPSTKNREKIEADTGIIEQKTKKFLLSFGKPYKKAVDALLNELGETREEFIPVWKEEFMDKLAELEVKDSDNNVSNDDNPNNRERLFRDFWGLEKYKDKKDKINKAKEAFIITLKEHSFEPVGQLYLNSCIMEALGVPRLMTPITFKRFMIYWQDAILNYMKKSPCGNCKKPITLEDLDDDGNCIYCKENPGDLNLFSFGSGKSTDIVEKLTFNEELKEGAPLINPEHIPYICKHLKLIEDLLIRLKKSGVKNLTSITKEELKGVSDLEYLTFTYKIEIKGSLKSIRAFMNSLNEAYKDNRIYKVRKVELEAKEDAKSIISIKKHKSNASKKNKTNKSEAEINTEKVGVPIIGNDDTIIAKIRFDYIMYIADEFSRE